MSQSAAQPNGVPGTMKCPSPNCGGDMPLPEGNLSAQLTAGEFASVIVIPNGSTKCPRCYQEYSFRVMQASHALLSPQVVQWGLVAVAPKEGVHTPPQPKLVIPGR